jgi:tetratricopeptide (TPR) repeat protein
VVPSTSASFYFCRMTVINNKKGISSSYTNIGKIFSAQGNYPLSLDYFYKAKEISEEIHDEKEAASILIHIGNILIAQKMLPQALEHYQTSLVTMQIFKDSLLAGKCLLNIGLIYSLQNQYRTALDYFEKGKRIFEKIDDQQDLSYSYNNIAEVYEKQGEYDKALPLYQASIKLKEKIQDLRGITYSLDGISRLLQKQHRLNESIEYAQKGLGIAQKIGSLAEVKMLSKTLYTLHKEKGEPAKALNYYELLSQTSDSLFNLDKARLIANLESKIELEKKEKEIELLNQHQEVLEKEKKQQNAITYLVFISLVLTAFFSFYAYRSWRKERKAKQLIIEQNTEIEALNNNLEVLVKQRTEALANRSKQLEEYAFFNAHILRAPVATILGLFNIYKMEKNDNDKEVILNHLNNSVIELEKVVGKIQEIVDNHEQ